MKREELILFCRKLFTKLPINLPESLVIEKIDQVITELSLSPAAVNESEKPITAEEILKSHLRRYINTLHATEPIQLMALGSLISAGWYKDVINAMEEYAASRTVKESLTVEPMTAEEILDDTMRCTISDDDDLDNPENFYFKYNDVLEAMRRYASKPTVAEREVREE